MTANGTPDNKSYFKAHAINELPALDFASAEKREKVFSTYTSTHQDFGSKAALNHQLEAMLKPFLLDDTKIGTIKDTFRKELETSLTQGDKVSSVHSEYTFLTELLDGTGKEICWSKRFR